MTGPWPALLVRPDDTPGVGAGHVMRTLALVEEWGRGGTALVALREGAASPYAPRVSAAGGRVVGAAENDGAAGVRDAIEQERPAWVVLDGYGLDVADQEAVRALGPRLAVVDDHGHQHRYAADLVIDQNLGTAAGTRPRPGRSGALLGPRFALLRDEFRSARPSRGGTPPLVVVTLGGSATERAEALAAAVADGIAGAGLDVTVTTPDRAGATDTVADLLARADVVVSGAGTTSWELCGLGRPAVLVGLVDNQFPVGEALDAAGAARYLGPLDEVGAAAVAEAVTGLLRDERERAGLAARARSLVDGRGATRVVTELRSALVTLRPAREDDRERLWRWANDPVVRGASFGTEPIPWEDHVRWFEGIGAGRRLQYVAEADGQPWGQIRFELDGDDHAHVGVSITRGCRGCRAAAPLIRAGTRRALADAGLAVVHAAIRHDNTRSQQAFLAADYALDAPRPADGIVRLTYARGRDGRS